LIYIILLVAEGFPVPLEIKDDSVIVHRMFLYILEPVGSKAPAFTGDVKGVWMEKSRASNVVLPCPAQGYPVPSFRYSFYIYILHKKNNKFFYFKTENQLYESKTSYCFSFHILSLCARAVFCSDFPLRFLLTKGSPVPSERLYKNMTSVE